MDIPQQLIAEAAKAGTPGESARHELVIRLEAELKRIVIAMLKAEPQSQQNVQSIVNDAAKGLLKGLVGFKPNQADHAKAVVAFARTIARHAVRDHQRQQAKKQKLSLAPYRGPAKHAVTPVSFPARKAEGRAALDAAINALDGDTGAIVRMASRGLSNKEIAFDQGISEEAARKRLSRALPELAAKLRPPTPAPRTDERRNSK